MSEIKNIPRLRFPSFYDEWKQDKLGKVINFQNGVGHERSIDENGNVVVVNSKFISTDGTVRKYTDKVLSIIPDDSLCMVMSDVPNGKAIAKCYYFETGNHFSLNQRICSIKSETEVNKFLFYRINRHKYYLKFDNGVGQTNLRKSEVLNCPIKLPSLPEQQKIADFLTVVDKRIELLEKKKTLLETYKKGVMKKIFNQEIRFKDDKGNDFPDWEEKRLDEISKFRRGSFPQPYGLPEWYDDINGIPFVQVYDVGENFKLKSQTKQKISSLAQPKSVFVPKESILITIQGSIGRVAITQYDSYVDRTLLIFTKLNENLNKYFFVYQLYRLFDIEKRRAPGGTIKTITKEKLSSFTILIPDEGEQLKISNFLFSIDKQLEILDTQIEKSKTWKKGLLQKMFV